MSQRSHARSGGSRRTRSAAYTLPLDNSNGGSNSAIASWGHQSETFTSPSRRGGILRNHNRIDRSYRSDDSYSSSSAPRSRDSSVDSLPEPSNWTISGMIDEHRVPLTGGGNSSTNANTSNMNNSSRIRTPRRASLGGSTSAPTVDIDSSERSVSYRTRSKAALGHTPTVDGPKKSYKTTRRKMTRRASLSDVPSNNNNNSNNNAYNNSYNYNSEESNSDHSSRFPSKMARRSSLGDETPPSDSTPMHSNYRPRAKMGRRASMGDSPSSDSYQYQQQQQPPVQTQPLQPITHTQQPRPRSILRRSSLDNIDQSSDDGINYLDPCKMTRRSSFLGDSAPKTAPLNDNEGSTSRRSSMKMTRRSSLTDVKSTDNDVAPPMPKRGILRRGSMSDMPSSNMNMHSSIRSMEDMTPAPPKRGILRRGSMSDMPSSNRSSMSDYPSKPSSIRSMEDITPAPPKRGILRRGSMSDMPSSNRSIDLAPAVPKRGILRRGSMSDMPSSNKPSSNRSLSDVKTPVPKRSILRRGSMSDMPSLPSSNHSLPATSDTITPEVPKRSILSDHARPEPSSLKDGIVKPKRSILRRGSLSDIGSEPSSDALVMPQRAPVKTNDQILPQRVPVKKMGRRASLSDAPSMTTPLMTTGLNDTLSASCRGGDSISNSYRVPTKMQDTLTPLPSDSTKKSILRDSSKTPTSAKSMPYRSSLNDISTPPLNEGYCVPLKSMTQRIECTTTSLKGMEADTTPLSKSERSMNRRSFRSTRTASSYYSDRSTLGSSMNSITSIPIDVYESGYNDSMVSGLGVSARYSNRTNRSIALSESGSDDSDTYDSDDNSTSRNLDEMERSTGSASGIISFDDSWSLHNLALEQKQTDLHLSLTPFSDQKPKRRIDSIKIPAASMDFINANNKSNSNRDDSAKLLRMEMNLTQWSDDDDDDSVQSFMDEEPEPRTASRRGSLQFNEIMPRQGRRVSSLAWNDSGSTIGLGESRKSIAWEDQSNGHESFGASKNSVTWEDESFGASRQRSVKSLTWEDDSLAPPNLTRRSSLELDDGSDDSLGDFASLPSRNSLVKQSSEQSLGDFAGSGASGPSLAMEDSDSEGSLGEFFGGGPVSDDDSSSSESDGIIRDDEIFSDALQHMVESSAPPGFNRSQSRRGSVGDYTLSLSGKGDINDIDRSEKSITFGPSASRRRSISSINMDASIRSRDITTISEDSFEITAEELFLEHGGADEASFKSCSSSEVFDDSLSFYDSDEEKEKEKEQRIKDGLKWGLGSMAIGAIVGWVVKRFRKNNEEDDVSLDIMDDEMGNLSQSIFDELGQSLAQSAHDDLGQSIAHSLLDESVNFTGSEHLWGWASLGDGGASGELIVGALHMPGTDAAIIAAATGGGGTNAGATAAAAAAAAATTNTMNTMAVTAAANVTTAVVTTTTTLGNSAVAAAGAGVGIGAAAAAGGATAGATAGAAGSGVLAALGLTGTGGSAAAVMGSTIGALALAGSTYYSAGLTPMHNATGYNMTKFADGICPHPNPDNQTGVFRLTIDVTGMKGTNESWGWMPFSDGVGVNNTSSEVLKEVWEELFANAYNDLTEGGCNEIFERRVLNATLFSTTHTGSFEGSDDAFLETEWEVAVSCWDECPTEPIFGTELRRNLEPASLEPSTLEQQTEMTDADVDYSQVPRSLISQLDFQTHFEFDVKDAATDQGWEDPKADERSGVSLDQPANDSSIESFVIVSIDESANDQPTNDDPNEQLVNDSTIDQPVSEDPLLNVIVTNPPFTTPLIISNAPGVSKTRKPSSSPSAKPSENPTPSPTDWPTESPTHSPSKSPTDPPTHSPTEPPTKSPTDWPTESPTTHPSNSPSTSSSPSSVRPTFSTRSSASPSGSPSGPLIANDSPPLTGSPTSSVSKHPTSTPSTSEPSASPSESPTGPPSASPSGSPSASQSDDPSGSYYPSITPSERPSISLRPSASPSSRPTTKSPSDSPSSTPTSKPSSPPSSTPSDAPSDSPTPLPSYPPSFTPTDAPSSIPTSSPSDSPSSPPTILPSSQPTDHASVVVDKEPIRTDEFHRRLKKSNRHSLRLEDKKRNRKDSCLPRFSRSCNPKAGQDDCCGTATCQQEPGTDYYQCLEPGDDFTEITN